MALSYAVRKQLLAAGLPESTEVRRELQDYLARTGMAPSDFARRINYARETVYQFLNGHYSRISSNDGLIRTAIRDFIAAHPIATPVISAGKLYETENARLLRQYFYEALDHGRAYYLYGAPGTQKTYVRIAERPDCADRADGLPAFGGHGGVDQVRFPLRAGGDERHHPFCGAHALQGHTLPHRAADCPGDGLHRRQPGRLYRQGDHLLQRQIAGRARPHRPGCADRPGAQSGLRRARHRARARRDSGRSEEHTSELQ